MFSQAIEIGLILGDLTGAAFLTLSALMPLSLVFLDSIAASFINLQVQCYLPDHHIDILADIALGVRLYNLLDSSPWVQFLTRSHDGMAGGYGHERGAGKAAMVIGGGGTVSLSKEDEAAIGQEVEVRREDQDKINKFSRLHQKELVLEEDLKSKNKEKEELEEVTTELELADEDDIVPYKIGDAFFHVSLEQAQDMLGLSTAKIEEGVEEVEEKLGTVREEMTQLKVELYARFGKSINLET
ncbi:uncharacterized protein MKZ38_003336 [Zalerion maritima]|uniref:Prefoldin subunit 4 n=1 Tax=Zalerion maritima TaxID=339359 RepID=A0AAD5WRX3_9PEZI|nr:uncharacterized protein MKZ38_003336 [Zalerion maritima]